MTQTTAAKREALARLYRAAENGESVTIDAAALTPEDVLQMAGVLGIRNVDEAAYDLGDDDAQDETEEDGPARDVAGEDKAQQAYQLGSIDAYAERAERDMDDEGSAWLMDALGETGPTTVDNFDQRARWCDEYGEGYRAASRALA